MVIDPKYFISYFENVYKEVIHLIYLCIKGGSGNEATKLTRAQSIFALAWFHAVVQERRTFIPQGWCKFYEFSDGDLKAGLEVLNQLFRQLNR